MDQATTTLKRTGMVGLGAMGLQMARHMADKGFDVAGYDVSTEAMKQAQGHKVKPQASTRDVGKHAEVVLIMVQTDKQVEEVAAGLIETLARGAVICIASSVAPETCQRVAKLAAPKGIDVLDTPVVLGQEATNNGTATIYVGGDAKAFARARPALAAFGAQVLHLGALGTGQIAKTINNMLLWACMSANYEALTLARKLGADIPKLIEAMAHGSGANWSLSRWGKSTGKWAEKDMDVALDMAQAAKCPVPLAGLVDQLMKGMNQEKMKALLS
jgi:3-hydroxyisobutyrate dehydrogenase-like beta-hydroxyacid dehydrogenase